PALLESFSQRNLFRCLFRNRPLHVHEMGVIVVADRTDGKTAGTVAERADHAQEPLPETEYIARARHGSFLPARSIDETIEELQDGRESEFLRLACAGALVDPEMQDGIGGAGMQAAAAPISPAHPFPPPLT